VEPRHSLLRRQIKRSFGSLEDLPPDVRRFIESVDTAYLQADSDRSMLERSFELTSQELGQANSNLRQAVQALHDAQRDLEARVVERTRQLADRDEELRHAQKMESVGRLAGGVAHDFNNLLTVIFGNCDLLLAEVLEPDSREAAEQIRKAAESAASVTKQLLAFSRRQFLSPKVISLNELVREAQGLFGRFIGEHIELGVHLDPLAGSIRADPGQINQVLLNLVVNARDAMPEGGTLSLVTDRRVVEAGEGDIQPGEYVALTVTDTGVGMKPDVCARVFEPFFTTKEIGRGTGLGLATVYGIVKQSDGYIDVTSEEGKGSTFCLLFPREADAAAEAGLADDQSATDSHGVILVAEDQDGVRACACNWLRQRGYTVVEARDGVEALEKFHTLPRVDLLLTDVVMPRMNGRALVAKISAAKPGLKILYMTGYIDDAELIRAVRDSRVPVLQKPFNADSLVRVVRETIQSEHAV
jgi:two-component system, cell cycle sensor histidine kinase and response regulator CckA